MKYKKKLFSSLISVLLIMLTISLGGCDKDEPEPLSSEESLALMFSALNYCDVGYGFGYGMGLTVMDARGRTVQGADVTLTSTEDSSGKVYSAAYWSTGSEGNAGTYYGSGSGDSGNYQLSVAKSCFETSTSSVTLQHDGCRYTMVEESVTLRETSAFLDEEQKYGVVVTVKDTDGNPITDAGAYLSPSNSSTSLSRGIGPRRSMAINMSVLVHQGGGVYKGALEYPGTFTMNISSDRKYHQEEITVKQNGCHVDTETRTVTLTP